MSFGLDALISWGSKFLPDLIADMPEDKQLLIVPSKGRLFICLGNFAPRIPSKEAPKETDKILTVSVIEKTECEIFIIPDQLDELIKRFKDKDKNQG